MSIGLVGRKSGMTRVFTEAGLSVPVTVVEVSPNRVTQIKTLETDGYSAVQVTTGERKASNHLQGILPKLVPRLVQGFGNFVLRFQSSPRSLLAQS
jgi:ribosomal protein L3